MRKKIIGISLGAILLAGGLTINTGIAQAKKDPIVAGSCYITSNPELNIKWCVANSDGTGDTCKTVGTGRRCFSDSTTDPN